MQDSIGANLCVRPVIPGRQVDLALQAQAKKKRSFFWKISKAKLHSLQSNLFYIILIFPPGGKQKTPKQIICLISKNPRQMHTHIVFRFSIFSRK